MHGARGGKDTRGAESETRYRDQTEPYVAGTVCLDCTMRREMRTLGGLSIKTTLCALLQYEHLIKEDVLVVWWMSRMKNVTRSTVSPLLQIW